MTAQEYNGNGAYHALWEVLDKKGVYINLRQIPKCTPAQEDLAIQITNIIQRKFGEEYLTQPTHEDIKAMLTKLRTKKEELKLSGPLETILKAGIRLAEREHRLNSV